jgi:hypothetical protein
MPCRQISRVGWNTPAFIISISAVPPETARIVGSSGSSSDIASLSDFGSTISNGIIVTFFSLPRHAGLVPGIDVLHRSELEDVDRRDKPGHDH